MNITGGNVKNIGSTIRIILTLCVLLQCGCTVGPDYVRPTAVETMPTSFKEQQGWKVAQPQDGTISVRWWEIYRDPVLNSLVERVEISNFSIASADARFRQARAVVQAAKAGYFPSLS